MLTVRLLGPFEVSLDGLPVPLTTRRLRTLLATLAVFAGQPVSADRLAAALWDEDPPVNARRAVQTYVTRLRAVLGKAQIGGTANGYVLHTGPDGVDAVRFMRLLDAATQATDTPAERSRLDEALTLWQGNPFDGVQSDWLVRTRAPRLVEAYLVAHERRVDIGLAEGSHLTLIGQLRELTARYPLREPLWVRLLAALDRGGRQAEALEQYERIRVRLAEELGTEPGPELRQVHADLLAGDPVTTASTATTATASGTPVTHSTLRQLPAPVSAFSGRIEALNALDGWLARGEAESAPAEVWVITGTPGIGKTTLAVQWAHRVADRFPDGQLYANLRGYHPSGHAVSPAEAVRGFLDAFGVSPNRVPSALDAQAALYRSLISGKRMLVLLDNARDAEQVRHLLPGSPGCLTVITSRNQLTGLVAAVAARHLTLDLLTSDESRELLAARLGADRVGADAASADEIGARCARLPLALAVVAALAASREDVSLGALSAELRESQSGLDAFSTGDPTTDARAVFSWSYSTLSPPAARLFRLLGLHPGPDISTSAAASLAALPTARVRPLLVELCRAHLLIANAARRYAFHDLLRAYAGELVASQDSDAERRAALRRLLDHLVHSGYSGAMQLSPDRTPFALTPPESGVTVDVLAHYDQTMDWFAAERDTLLAAVDTADQLGFDVHAWQLPSTFSSFLFRRGYLRDLWATQQIALEAARRVESPEAEAMAHVCLGTAQQFLGEDSHLHLERALELYDQEGDLAGMAYVHWFLSRHFERDDRTRSLHHAEESLRFAQAAGDQYAEARALNAVGWEHLHLGNQEQGLTFCQRALALNQQIGNRLGEANTWDSLALAHHQAGNHADAITCYESALRLFRDLEVRVTEAGTLCRLAETHLAAGDHGAARAAWQQALSILDPLDHPDAERVRAALDDLATTGVVRSAAQFGLL